MIGLGVAFLFIVVFSTLIDLIGLTATFIGCGVLLIGGGAHLCRQSEQKTSTTKGSA